MLTREKWQRITGPLYSEEFNLLQKEEDTGLTEEEKRRLEHVQKVLNRLVARFLKHSKPSRDLPADGTNV